MINQPDRSSEIKIQQRIIAAKKSLKGTRGELIVSILPEKPKGLNGAVQAFEFRPGDTQQPDNPERLLRFCALFGETWVEVMPLGVTNEQRKTLPEILGYKPNQFRELPVPAPQPYLGERLYYVEEKQKGGV